MAATPVNVYTEEKAQRLMRTFRASLAFASLVCLFEIAIVRPSDDMEKEMVSCLFVCLLNSVVSVSAGRMNPSKEIDSFQRWPQSRWGIFEQIHSGFFETKQ